MRSSLPLRNKVSKPQQSKMSSLFYSPYRHHPRSYGNYHRGGQQLSPWGRSSPAFSASPWGWGVEPFSFNEPFHAPFQSLFNDTFSQLERLTNEMNTHLNDAFGEQAEGQGTTWQKLLTSTPKFDVKETDEAYILEGELPGVAKKDVSLDFADDNTLLLKTKTETFREQKPAAPAQSEQKQVEGAGAESTQMTGANPDAATQDADKDKQVTTTNGEKSVAAPAAPQPTYHLTERTYGSFQRAFSFPAPVKHEEVKAKLSNGVLTVTVPKVQKDAEPEKKSRSVTVEDASEEDQAMDVEKETEKSKL